MLTTLVSSCVIGSSCGWDEPLLGSMPTPGRKKTFTICVLAESGRILTTLQTMALSLTIIKILKAGWLSGFPKMKRLTVAQMSGWCLVLRQVHSSAL